MHEAFLQAIADDPADDVNRLVYADWLEDQGDPRGEYIRLRLQPDNPRTRERVRARLADLAAGIDGDWRRRVFLRPKLTLQDYHRVYEPITEPVTKFGGQPVWLGDPAWPVSRDGEVMQFVCQVCVPEFFGPALAGKMVYVFAVHPDHANWVDFCGTVEPLSPHTGHNAVVIQPGGDPPAPTQVWPLGSRGQRLRKRPLRVLRQATGLTLYDNAGQPGEWRVDLVPGADPDYTENTNEAFPDEVGWKSYFDQTYGEKVGGTPVWGNGLASELESLADDPDWCLLLTFRYNRPYFSVWEGFEWYVGISRDGKRGFLMADR